MTDTKSKVQDNELTHMTEWNTCDWFSLGARGAKIVGGGLFFFHLVCGENEMLPAAAKTFLIGAAIDGISQYVKTRAATGSHEEAMKALFAAAPRL